MLVAIKGTNGCEEPLLWYCPAVTTAIAGTGIAVICNGTALVVQLKPLQIAKFELTAPLISSRNMQLA